MADGAVSNCMLNCNNCFLARQISKFKFVSNVMQSLWWYHVRLCSFVTIVAINIIFSHAAGYRSSWPSQLSLSFWAVLDFVFRDHQGYHDRLEPCWISFFVNKVQVCFKCYAIALTISCTALWQRDAAALQISKVKFVSNVMQMLWRYHVRLCDIVMQLQKRAKSVHNIFRFSQRLDIVFVIIIPAYLRCKYQSSSLFPM